MEPTGNAVFPSRRAPSICRRMDTSDSEAIQAASLSSRAMAARPAPYLEGLNPAQMLAVCGRWTGPC